MKRTTGVLAAFPTAGRCPPSWPVCPRGETIVASDITLAVGDGARCMSGLCAALVIILGFAALPAQAGPAPREPYSCRLYVDAHRQCERTLHRATTRRTSPRPEKPLRSEALLARMATRPMFSSTRSCRPIKGRCSGANVRPFAARWVNFAQCTPPLSVDPTRSGARAGRSGIGAASP